MRWRERAEFLHRVSANWYAAPLGSSAESEFLPSP